MLVHHQKGFQNQFFVNDPYDLDVSIKDSEHEQQAGWIILRWSESKCVHEKDDVFPNLKQFNDFPENPGNKIWLQHFLKLNSKAC